MRMSRLCVAVLLVLAASIAWAAPRNDWYWDSPVNIHWDNHSGALGQGMSVDEIAALFEGLNVDMIQVSARSTPYATYPTEIGIPRPNLDGYDTMATWRAVTRKLGMKMCVYINVIEEPKLTPDHPEWMRVDAKGNKSRVCNRPSADGSGYLETIMAPMVREIIARYDVDGFWFDGDWQIPSVCYCPNCRAAWKRLTGKDEPPKDAGDPDWPRWITLEQQRRDEYKRKLAEAIHQASDHCMYTSNWSWAISHRDPRTAPEFADTLSGDVGGGSSQGALYGLRFSCLFLSAQEHTPHDVMSAVYPKKVRTLPRMLQEGALVMSSGSSWFLWVNRLTPDQFDHLRACVGLVDARREALGRTYSLNPIAVLLSETTWRHGLTSAVPGYYDSSTPRSLAFALQDAYYGVDVVNEQTLCERLRHYQVVFVAGQRAIAAETLAALRQFVQDGGTLIVTGAGLRTGEQEDPEISALLGLSRSKEERQQVCGLTVAGGKVPLRGVWQASVSEAEVLAAFTDSDLPALTVRTLSKGQVAYFALSRFPYPDDDGLALWIIDKLRIPPMVSVSGPARDNHLAFSVRRKGDSQVALHIADMTTYAGGRRIEPNSSHEIDPVQTIPEVPLRVALATKPQSVRVLPAASDLEWHWEDGLLRLSVSNVNTHAVVIADIKPPERMKLLPRGVEAAPARKYAYAPVLLSEDFESTPVGKFPDKPIWTPIPDPKTAIRVTEETSAEGKRSLEFVDAPDARAPFVPYLVIFPRRLDRGRARFSCDLRLEAGSKANIEFRETRSGSPYVVGPSIHFNGTGEVLAYDKKLTSVPLGQWFRCEIEFGLGFSGPTYDVTIRCSGKAAQEFSKLPYRDTSFLRCDWLGIISHAEAKSSFYVDNVRLQRLP